MSFSTFCEFIRVCKVNCSDTSERTVGENSSRIIVMFCMAQPLYLHITLQYILLAVSPNFIVNFIFHMWSQPEKVLDVQAYMGNITMC